MKGFIEINTHWYGKTLININSILIVREEKRIFNEKIYNSTYIETIEGKILYTDIKVEEIRNLINKEMSRE